MKIILLISFVLIPQFVMGSENLQILADVGFQGSNLYIGIEFEESDRKLIYSFSLCNTLTSRCSKLSDCKYTEASILKQIDHIVNKSVKQDFDWLFFRSGYSSTSFDNFFIEFKALLERARGIFSCPIKKLETLKSEINVRTG